MKKILLHIGLFFISMELSAQTILWEKLMNYLSNQETIYFADITTDSSIVACGYNGGSTYFFKININGDTLWLKQNPNVVSCQSGEDIKQLKDGNLMHFGSQSFDACSSSDFVFQKLNSNGNILSSWNYGEKPGLNISYSFTETPDGNFLGAGVIIDASYNFTWNLIKIASNGDSLWYKIFRPTYGSNATGISVNRKGNYLTYTYSGIRPTSFPPVFTPGHPYYYELSPEGDSLKAGSITIKDDSVTETLNPGALIQSSTGDYILSSRIDTMDASKNSIGHFGGVTLLDSNFNKKWTVILRPSGSQRYYTSKVIELRDSSFFVGVIEANPYTNRIIFYKISKDGQTVQQNFFISSLCSSTIINEMKLMPDSSLIVLGSCNDGQNAYVARIGSIGLPAIVDTCKTFTTSFTADQIGDSLKFINTSNSGYAYAWQSSWKFSDSTTSNTLSPKIQVTGTIDSVWAKLIATNPYGCSDTIAQKIKVSQVTAIKNPTNSYQSLSVNVFPNPFFQSTTFNISGSSASTYKLSITNTLGESVATYEIKNQNTFTLNRAGITSGLYFYVMSDEEGKSSTGKLLVE